MQSAIVELVQTLVGLPLRAPADYVPYDSDAEENVWNDLKPFKIGEDACKDADTIWAWHLEQLAQQLPRQAGKLTTKDLVGSSCSILVRS